MNRQKFKQVLPRVLLPVGIVALVVGALDPLEGSVIILLGSGLVALATWLRNQDRSKAIYRTWLFGLIALGILAMFVLSHLGGVGGPSGRPLWWLLLLLPYPIGWLLEIANLIVGGWSWLRRRRPRVGSNTARA